MWQCVSVSPRMQPRDAQLADAATVAAEANISASTHSIYQAATSRCSEVLCPLPRIAQKLRETLDATASDFATKAL